MKRFCIALCFFALIGVSCHGCAALWFAGGAAGGAAGTHVYKQYRECPYCKKKIKKDATVCPYCERKVTPIKE
jgi:predicted amidophosphoribosyltransferase